MKRSRYPLLLALVLLFLTIHFLSLSTVFAADAVTSPSLGDSIADVINKTLLPLVLSLVGALVSLALAKLKARWNISLSAEREEWIMSQAENAVGLVAEKAADKIKQSAGKMTQNEKLTIAIAFLVSKVPALSHDQADAYIHAALARLPGVGATGDQVVK